MIVVNSGIMQDKIKSLVEACDTYSFTFVKKEGIRLLFQVDAEDEDAAAIAAKQAIKADPIGSTLLISVKVEK